MASAVNGVTGSSSTTSSQSSTDALSSSDSEGVFLQLLVSQLQNQDPLNPTDSTQFVSELAQFSELEQVIGIRSDIETYAAQSSSSSTGQSNSTNSTSPTQS
ncbi:MAG TPA: flagellar hook capping FlgD N-terminal domain-containing protein [Bryobacteraceae bacterium]|nr:flagellar hook capping FlgD N-terminal domain-containing protein [Bryobacteraceae bacterium]